MRNETSECEVRVVLIWTKSTRGLGASYTAKKYAWQPCDPGCTPVEMDCVLVFQLSQGYLNILLDGCLRLSHDGEGGMTSRRIFRVLSIPTVRGRQVDGQA